VFDCVVFQINFDHEDLEGLVSKGAFEAARASLGLQTQVERTTEQYAPGGEVLLTALTALHIHCFREDTCQWFIFLFTVAS